MEKIADFLENSTLFRIWIRINQSVAVFALCVALVALYVAHSKCNEDKIKAKEDRISKAWEALGRIPGNGSNGGQINAMEALIYNNENLNYVNLKNAYLVGVDMKNVSLIGADLSGANLSNSNLQGVNLLGASLKGALIMNANLGGVNFEDAKLDDAVLSFSKLDISVVLAKSMKRTDITGVRFVLEDRDGVNDFSMFGDTLAENWRADERQIRINESCSDRRLGKLQHNLLPIKINNNPCRRKLNYQLYSAAGVAFQT